MNGLSDNPDNDSLPLTLGEVGHLVRVDRVTAKGEDAIRLKRMGVCAGFAVNILHGGDPMVLGVSGSQIAISKQLASCIFVRPSSELNPDTDR